MKLSFSHKSTAILCLLLVSRASFADNALGQRLENSPDSRTSPTLSTTGIQPQPLSVTSRLAPGSSLIGRYNGANFYYSLATHPENGSRRICGGLTVQNKDYENCLTLPGTTTVEPGTPGWVATSSTGAPSARTGHAAVWTGSKMVIWGGYPLADVGGVYDPTTDSWSPTSTIGAPIERIRPSGVWTGDKAIFWGGVAQTVEHRRRRTITHSFPTNTGGMYDPAADSWVATSTNAAPEDRTMHTAIWTGSKMIVWGGFFEDADRQAGVLRHYDDGASFDPATNQWQALPQTGAPEGRYLHTAVWTGTEMLIWGGRGPSAGGEVNSGARFNPTSGTWTAMSTANAPSARYLHTAVWTGQKMAVWGGAFNQSLPFSVSSTNTGGLYDPFLNIWTTMSPTGAPESRVGHTAVWTGSKLIVWGGINPQSWTIPGWITPFSGRELNTGGVYDVATDSWSPTLMTNVPPARAGHTAVWSGSEMIVWGGLDPGYVSTGGRYTP